MFHTRVTLVVGLCCLIWAGRLAEASIVRSMALDELVQGSDQIVVGKVLSVKSDWDAAHRTILTTIQIQVDEGWKGVIPNDGKITIVQQGGTVGETEMAVQGMPQFSINEQAVLFLQGKERRFVLGMNQGKRTLSFDGKSKRWFAEPASRKGVIRLQPKDKSGKVANEAAAARISLDSLRDEVRALLKKK